MAAETRPAARPSRRRVLAIWAWAGFALSATGGAAWAQSAIAVVSRERLLRETQATLALREAEERMTVELQAAIDAAQAQLADEEAELARLRADLDPAEFDARATDFDQRIRTLRRRAQERVTQLDTGFQQARASIVAALPAILERLRLNLGLAAILNADEALALDPTLDLTERAIALYDATGPRPAAPDVDLRTPLLPPPAPGAPASGVAEDEADGQ